VRGVALLREGLPADERALRQAMSGNLCRCTGYAGIIQALRRAAQETAPTPVATPTASPEGSG